jgi:autotransporter passenger strand-loop-strand repeat protein
MAKLVSGSTFFITPPSTARALITDLSDDGRYVAWLIIPLVTDGSDIEHLAVGDFQSGGDALGFAESVYRQDALLGTKEIHGGELSADAHYLVYSINNISEFSTAGTNHRRASGNVFRINLQTGTVKQLNGPPTYPDSLGFIADGISGTGNLVLYNAVRAPPESDLEEVVVQTVSSGSKSDAISTTFSSGAEWQGLDISEDGRYVLLQGIAGSVAGQLKVKDLQTGAATAISVPHGNAFNPPTSVSLKSASGCISADGRSVAFEADETFSSGLQTSDVYVEDLLTGILILASSKSDGTPGNGASRVFGISADGHHVLFSSVAPNLFPSFGVHEALYVKYLDTGLLTFIANTPQPSTRISGANISADGGTIAYSEITPQHILSDEDVYSSDFLKPSLVIHAIAGDDRINAVEANGPIIVSGTSDAIGGKVLVTGDSVTGIPVSHLATVQSDGTWSTTFSVSGLADGAHAYHAQVTDDVGMLTAADRTATIDRAPPLLSITSVAGDDIINAAEKPNAQIAGISTAVGQSVILLIDGNFAGSAVVQADGTWQAAVDASAFPDGFHNFGAFVSDAAGNIASTNRQALIDTTPPKIAILSVSGNDVVSQGESTAPVPIIGTSDAIGQTVSVYRDGQLLGQTTVQADGTWSLSTFIGPALAGSHLVQAAVADPAGNSASTSVQVLVDAPIRLVSTPTLENGVEPSVSADGRFVAFLTYDTSGIHPNRIWLRDMATGALQQVSVGPGGAAPNDDSSRAAISADGQHVAFLSEASNLVAGDTPFTKDVFVRDLGAAVTTLVDSDSGGTRASGADTTQFASISADGRYVAFVSYDTTLVAGDTNNARDVFVKDTQTGAIVRASIGTFGQANADSNLGPSLSADGRLVAFSSPASNLVAGDTNTVLNGAGMPIAGYDIFVKNLDTGAIQLVSRDSNGVQPSDAFEPTLSADGHFVAFNATYSDGILGTFIKNLDTGELIRVSARADGTPADVATTLFAPSISADDRYVAFESNATNLVSGVTGQHGEIYVKDLQTSALTLATIGNGGFMTIRSGFSSDVEEPQLSGDGRYVVFNVFGTTHLTGDPAVNFEEVFERDLRPHSITVAPIGAADVLGAADLKASQPVSGTSDLIGSTVSVWLDGSVVNTATVQADGSWSSGINTLNLSNGRHQLSASMVDPLRFQSSDGQILQVETQGPIVTISSDRVHLITGQTATIAFIFDQDVNGFDLNDITVTGGSLGPLTATSGHSFTATFTPDPGKHVATIQVSANAVTDAAGNSNSAAGMVFGLAVDGYISGATVFADANGNGVRDPGEVATTTDAVGAFVLSGGSGPLVLFHGTDIATKLPFDGLLSAPAGSTVITPLTTLLTSLQQQGVANPQATLLHALGLPSGIAVANYDPIASATNGDSNGQAMYAGGGGVLDTITLIAAALAGGDAGKFSSTVNDAFAQLAGMIGAAPSALNLSDPSQIATLLNHVLAFEGQSRDSSFVNDVAQIAAGLNAAVASSAQSGNGIDALAGIDAAEIVAQGTAADALKNAGTDTAKLDAAVTAFTGANLNAAVATAQSETGDVVGPDTHLAPVAHADSYSVAGRELIVGAKGVLANDTDADGDALTAILVSAPAHGALALHADGSFVYTASGGFIGSDFFSYKANDASADSNVASVSIAVGAVDAAHNGPPQAIDDSYSVNENTSIAVPTSGIVANDTDPEGDALTAVLVSDVQEGALTLNADGSFSYTPNPGYFGPDGFTYKANDTINESTIATVLINVQAPTVPSGAVLHVSSGQKVGGAKVLSGGLLIVDSGGTALSTMPSGGNDQVSSGGIARGTLVGSGSTETVSGGGSASGTVVSNGGTQSVLSGGTADAATVNGEQDVGGSAGDGTVYGGGQIHVMSGGTTTATAVSSDGTELVFSGGTAVATTVGTGGLELVSSGGTAIGPVINGGTEELAAGAIASGAISFGVRGVLRVDGNLPANMPSAAISGLRPGDTIDLAGVGFDIAGRITASSNVLQVVENGHTYDFNLDPSHSLAGWELKLSADGSGGTDIHLGAQRDDFNLDRSSDILFRNDASGDSWFEAIYGGAFAGWQQIGGSNTSYAAVGVGDFYGIGTADIVFRNALSGDTWFEAIYGGAFAGWQQIGGSNTSYAVVGMADFYGNGTDDILFRNSSSGDTWFAAMSNGAFAGWNQVGGSDTRYSVVGVGDFYGNGTDDLLYRNDATGDTWLGAISNGVFNGWHQIGGSDTHYSVVGVGDFIGNGIDDILFRNNSSGDTWFEAISNGAFNGWRQVGGSDTNYAVVGVGDYFGNGSSDILFRNNSTGDTWYAAMSGGSFTGWHQVGGSDTSYNVKT